MYFLLKYIFSNVTIAIESNIFHTPNPRGNAISKLSTFFNKNENKEYILYEITKIRPEFCLIAPKT